VAGRADRVVVALRSLLLGIDVSPKRLGWGLVDLVTGDPVACGCESIDLPDHGWMHQQVQRALFDGPTNSMFEPGCRKASEIQCVFIEDTAQAGKYRQHDAGRAQGIVQAEVERRWPHVVPVQFLKPSEWKKLAGLKGNATKVEVMTAATSIWDGAILSAEPDAMSWNGIDTQDAADALLIAVAGQRRNDETWERGSGGEDVAA
jgi:Holliday junction resolvasome RuvABC endonuclease subunit